MTLLFYYLTEDSSNAKERNEVDYLSSIGRVVVVTRGKSLSHYGGKNIKNLNLPKQSASIASIFFIWTKICYLLSRSSSSLTDKGFPVRNIYTGNTFLQWIINRLWSLKYFGIVNRLLPVYEDMYFAPFRFLRIFSRDKRRSNHLFRRIVVHDSLILRLTRFTPFILLARRHGYHTIANVKSWDNPFYTQFIQNASGYLIWNSSMWKDIQQFHRLRTSLHHIWGPRPFYNFACALQRASKTPSISLDTIVVGYAAAFCDELMAAHEVAVLAGIAEILLINKVDIQILFRPYPSVSTSIYKPLFHFPNIEIVDIDGSSLDRYGDGREIIRFGSDKERIKYLSRCNCFLSIGTSFTFEAALFGLPVIQYFVPKSERKTNDEMSFFGRLDISDHILNYFLPYLPVAKDIRSLLSLIEGIKVDSALKQPPLEMMEVMGFPNPKAEWNISAKQFVADMKLG